MFAKKITYSFAFLALAGSMLTSCSFVKEHTSPETYNTLTFSDGGKEEATLATVAYSQGDFPTAEKHILKSLEQNPQQTQALLVGALMSEKTGRLNRARQYYEELIVTNTPETSLLGNDQMLPEKMTDIAKRRLRLLDVKQSQLVIENPDGDKIFNISKEAGQTQRRSAIEEALFRREQQKIAENQPSSAEELKAVEILFNDDEQNIISRFLILKELAEKDLITKQEFLQARMTNVGGLLPLTHKPGAAGIEKSVPSPDVVIERIKVLKDAVESRAITPHEFSAERDLIIEALLPPTPRQRMRPKAPSRDVMGAAKDLRKLEILDELGLITNNEKIKEKAAIERYLGLNRAAPQKAATPAPKKAAAIKPAQPCTLTETVIKEQIKVAPVAPAPAPTSIVAAPATEISKAEVKVIEKIEEPKLEKFPVQETANQPVPLLPNVSSPF